MQSHKMNNPQSNDYWDKKFFPPDIYVKLDKSLVGDKGKKKNLCKKEKILCHLRYG
jgi:hypothetical protein